jgi:hypothetical protein
MRSDFVTLRDAYGNWTGPGTGKRPQISPLRYALPKNISKKGPQNCRSLGYARDDKGGSSCWRKGVFTMSGPATTLHITTALSFVIPSEAEGSAVLRTFLGYVV